MKCCTVLNLDRGEIIGCTLVYLAFLCPVASAPKSNFHTFRKVEYEKDLFKAVQRYEGQIFPDFDPWLNVLRRPFSHLFLSKRLEYWPRDCSFELILYRHVRVIYSGWDKVELFVLVAVQCNYVETSC